uniref:STI1 domain-containing protein n=1 Tax=Timspurckia oligopyrenoides TaxID=708627 RepID=A0A7S1ERX4_9RHOD|mmetsp:Transcript_2695/g.4744  ORF Transcript_2695/g.4744 Transcript_2695/m.4744 type:complete len:440 (+) Transcript_2695:111-1430(+)
MANIVNSLFGPDMWGKLAMNPETKPLLDDPEFVAELRKIQEDPSKVGSLSNDPRMMKVFTVLLSSIASSMPTEPPTTAKSTQHQAPVPNSKQQPELKKVKPDFSKMSDEERAPKESEWEKECGNLAYKEKRFDEALKHYEKAFELAPDNLALLTNRAAVKLETGDLDGCIEDCKRAIQENKDRNLRTDYKIIARAHARIGNAHSKKKEYALAIDAYQASLLEHRDDKVQDKLLEAKRLLKKQEEESYVDPELSKKAREEGNDAFRKADFPLAVKLYTEAIKRNPSDPAAYSNRAAAYTKLGEFPHGMKDCEKAIELDPKYMKAYSRKAAIHFFMKEYHKCLELYQKGLDQDPNSKEMREGISQTMAAIQRQSNSGEVDEAQVQHAMADPEIQSILMDPMVQTVLKQLQENPAAASQVMRNPDMASKINKLIAAGVLRTG